MQPVKASDSAYYRDLQNLIYDVTELRPDVQNVSTPGTRFQIDVFTLFGI